MLNNAEIMDIVSSNQTEIEDSIARTIAHADHRVWGMLDDLVQGASLHLIETALPTFKAPRDLAVKFCRTVARNYAINELKRHFNARSDFGADESLTVDADQTDALDREQNLARLERAINLLEVSDQLAVGMLMGGMPQKDIARALNVSAPTMTRRVRSIHEKLERALA